MPEKFLACFHPSLALSKAPPLSVSFSPLSLPRSVLFSALIKMDLFICKAKSVSPSIRPSHEWSLVTPDRQTAIREEILK